jgi:hypothetical protein
MRDIEISLERCVSYRLFDIKNNKWLEMQFIVESEWNGLVKFRAISSPNLTFICAANLNPTNFTNHLLGTRIVMASPEMIALLVP